MKMFFTYSIILIIVIVSGIYFWQEKSLVPTTNFTKLTTLEMDKDSVQLGVLPYAKTKTTIFRFRNTGDYPLIIKNVISSCGCTDTRWNKKPLAPGKIDSLIVHFTPNSLGQFHKSIEITCNTTPQRYFLHLTGFVEE